jgi:RpiB/LacA/LacB family sugar-phosphate isomerase
VRVAIGTDHAGFALKEKLKEELMRLGHEVWDAGVHAGEPAVDYPDYIFPVAERVSRGEADRGIVLGGSGIGESIAANKVRGIRASVVTSDETARLTRLHNDSNVLALGSRTNHHGAALSWLRIWLETPYEGGRHDARLRKIREYEDAHWAERT